jgi:hypothetical protein
VAALTFHGAQCRPFTVCKSLHVVQLGMLALSTCTCQTALPMPCLQATNFGIIIVQHMQLMQQIRCDGVAYIRLHAPAAAGAMPQEALNNAPGAGAQLGRIGVVEWLANAASCCWWLCQNNFTCCCESSSILYHKHLCCGLHVMSPC